MENPELADPIFQDMRDEEHATEAQLITEQKTLADLQKALHDLAAHDVSRGATIRSIRTQTAKVTTLQQQAFYYKVRSGQRKEWDIKEYKRRFDADLPWPDHQEAADYQEMKKLRTASMNWNDRVPKSTRYMKNPPVEAKAKPKEGGHEE